MFLTTKVKILVLTSLFGVVLLTMVATPTVQSTTAKTINKSVLLVKAKPNVVVYTMNGCSYCHELVSYLRDHNIAFTEKNISSSRSNRAELDKRSGVSAMPQSFINGKLFIGPDQAIDELQRLGA